MFLGFGTLVPEVCPLSANLNGHLLIGCIYAFAVGFWSTFLRVLSSPVTSLPQLPEQCMP